MEVTKLMKCMSKKDFLYFILIFLAENSQSVYKIGNVCCNQSSLTIPIGQNTHQIKSEGNKKLKGQIRPTYLKNGQGNETNTDIEYTVHH